MSRHTLRRTRYTGPRAASHLALVAVVALSALAACDTGDRASRQPLGTQASAPNANAATGTGGATESPQMPLAALTALEAGNTAYSEKKLDVALTKYQDAAAAAPAHAAPWFGIYMAAVEMKNTMLADSAMRRVKALSADPAALDAHATVTSPNNGLAGSGALPEGHPSAVSPALPPGHPTATPALPPGHPTPAQFKTDSTKRKRM